jgi:hypothetical protein
VLGREGLGRIGLGWGRSARGLWFRRRRGRSGGDGDGLRRRRLLPILGVLCLLAGGSGLIDRGCTAEETHILSRGSRWDDWSELLCFLFLYLSPDEV